VQNIFQTTIQQYNQPEIVCETSASPGLVINVYLQSRVMKKFSRIASVVH
jgi:hypothetical protein